MKDVEAINSLNYLLKEGYLLSNDDPDNPNILVTNKLSRLLEEMKEQKIQLQAPSPTTTLVRKERITLREFKDAAEVPGLIKTKGFSFNANRISTSAEKVFNKLVGSIDMAKLVEATKAYYKDESIARTTLSNYFIEGVWESVYKSFETKAEIKKKTGNSLRL
jgi:hypothetical protein